MGLSKSMEFLRNVFLEYFESESRARVVHAEGSEKGFDHFRIYTQTPEQKENGIAMLHRVYSEEVEMPAPNTDFNLTQPSASQVKS